MIDRLQPLTDAWETESRHAVELPCSEQQASRFLLLAVEEGLYPLKLRADPMLAAAAHAKWFFPDGTPGNQAGIPPEYGRHVHWRFWEAAGERLDIADGRVRGSFDRRIPTSEGERLLREERATVARWLLLAHQTDKLNEWHYSAASAALTRAGIEDVGKRNELAEALRNACRGIEAGADKGLDVLNEAVLETLERVSRGPQDRARKAVAKDSMYWWATPASGFFIGQWYEARFSRALATKLHERNLKLRTGLPMGLGSFIVGAAAAKRIESDERGLTLRDDSPGVEWTRSACTAIKAAQSALSGEAPRGVVPLAALLATGAYAQRREGMSEEDSLIVTIAAGRDALRELTGIDKADGLIEALEWLRSITVGGPMNAWPCIKGWGLGEARRLAGGGRPSAPPMIVEVGYPLAPFASAKLEKAYNAAGMSLPAELSMYSPVLPPNMAPKRAGYTVTAERQLNAFCMALPLIIMERREEYAARGIALDDELRKRLRREGIYHASKASLFESLCESWRETPEPRLRGILPERTGPVLIENEHGRFHFGPDFDDAHSMVLDAAGLTDQRRQDQAKSVEARKRRKGKPG